jgi:hypothetical protein
MMAMDGAGEPRHIRYAVGRHYLILLGIREVDTALLPGGIVEGAEPGEPHVPGVAVLGALRSGVPVAVVVAPVVDWRVVEVAVGIGLQSA